MRTILDMFLLMKYDPLRKWKPFSAQVGNAFLDVTWLNMYMIFPKFNWKWLSPTITIMISLPLHLQNLIENNYQLSPMTMMIIVDDNENHFSPGAQCLPGCDTAIHTLRYWVDEDWTFLFHWELRKNVRIQNWSIFLFRTISTWCSSLCPRVFWQVITPLIIIILWERKKSKFQIKKVNICL